MRDISIRFQLINVVVFVFLCSIFSIQKVQGQKHIYPPQAEQWDPDSLGNQRAVVWVEGSQPEVTVQIDWRNRNVKSNQKVYVVDSATNALIENVKELYMGPEKGVVTFSTASGKGIYYVYYLPYHLGGRSRYYPDAIYKTSSVKATDQHATTLSIGKGTKVLRLESADDFNSNEPMEVIVTEKEENALRVSNKGKGYLIFPETREYPIRMKNDLPQRWLKNPSSTLFIDTVKRGEYFTFQLGLWAFEQGLENVQVTFSALSNQDGNSISADRINSFNTEGIDYTGKPMTKKVDVEKGSVQALWFGLPISEQVLPGTYRGTATLKTANSISHTVPLQLTVLTEVVDSSEDEPWKQTRLHWINSTLAQENTVIKPYIPLEVNGNSIALLGRKLILAENGLPEQIQSYFTEEMTEISTTAKDLLSQPFSFNILNTDGKKIKLSNAKLSFSKKEAGTVSWKSESTSEAMSMQVNGTLEFDGFVNYEVKIVAHQDMSLQDIAMHIPMNVNSSKYLLGLGRKGGFKPEKLDWKWDVAHKNQDGMWLGDVNAGIQFTFKDENYQRPLNTNFYLQKPLIAPSSWANGDKGGIKITEINNVTEINSYSGERLMKKGDTLFYNFTLLITPFHSLQTDAQWNERYFHAYQPIDSVVKSGSNVINIHHANVLNPYINYPFVATREMKSYIDSAHQAGLKVKIYNTVREVSNRMYELFPLRSLGSEIFTPGIGKGYSWLQEHVHEDYIAAWYVPQYKDAALINSGMSRWHNYYVEGMNWLVDNIGIDGIYLDDVAFDRVTMKRVKRVMTKNGHAGLIDLHSANQYNERDGFNNSAHLYMEHFPYINRLWFGEYFDYEAGTPDFYLTEVSGIPFGLMGEMLQDGGNPWRGMVYGMTNRMPYQKQKPDQIWKLWDWFGMEGSKMIGYWVSDRPVKTNKSDILATVYQKNNKTMVAIASWAPSNSSIKLTIDWEKLGIDPGKAKIWTPEVIGFQPAASYALTDEIPVEMNKGLLLIIEEK